MPDDPAPGVPPTSAPPYNRVMLRTWSGILWLLVCVSLVVMYFTPQPQPVVRLNNLTGESLPGRHRPAEVDPGVELVPRKVGDFTMTERSGRPVTRDDLLGKPWVVNFIFTSCVMTCPANTTAMMKLAEQSKQADVRFVTMTVDPERDTPQRLSEYAEIYGADPEQWWFLTGDKAEIHRLILKSFLQVVEEQQGENRLLGYEFAHTDRVLHIGADGTILGQYLSTDPLEMTKLRRVLAGEAETPERNRFLVPRHIDETLNSAPEAAPQDRDQASSAAVFNIPPTATSAPPADAGETDLTASGDGQAEALQLLMEVANGEAFDFLTEQNTVAMQAAEQPIIPGWLAQLPVINALLNSLATVLLVAGYVLIRRKQILAHRNCMVSAFVVSILFLGCYLTYHFGLHAYTGESSKKFPDLGFLRQVYFVILFSHILLAVPVPVLAIVTIFQASRQRWERHRFWASITFPIWLYVSVTGVMIYWMLYHLAA